MPVKVTLETSPEDAERLVQAFKDGKLAEFGVTEMTTSGLEAAAPAKKWAGGENERRDAPKRDDVPPRG